MRKRVLVASIMLFASLAVLAIGPGVESPAKFHPPLDRSIGDRGELGESNCQVSGRRVMPLVCAVGPRDSEVRVVLFGDSHALQWGPALLPLAKQHGWRMFSVLRAGCAIADVPLQPACDKWRQNAMKQIAKLEPTHIVISTSIGYRYRLQYQGMDVSRKDSEPFLREGMTRTLERLTKLPTLKDGGKSITLIRDQILAPFRPAECLKKHGGRVAKCVFPKLRRFGEGFDVIAARQTGVGNIIDPVEALCGREWCSPTRGKILKYRDSDHITATYARTLSAWFDRRLEIG